LLDKIKRIFNEKNLKDSKTRVDQLSSFIQQNSNNKMLEIRLFLGSGPVRVRSHFLRYTKFTEQFSPISSSLQVCCEKPLKIILSNHQFTARWRSPYGNNLLVQLLFSLVLCFIYFLYI